jgi:hypothetical protein
LALHSTLGGVESARAAGGGSLGELVSMYLQVCAASSAAVLAHPQPRSQEQSLHWHARACSLADVLADPDPTLQLYHMLSKQELTAALSKMASSAREIVDRRGCFELRLN